MHLAPEIQNIIDSLKRQVQTQKVEIEELSTEVVHLRAASEAVLPELPAGLNHKSFGPKARDILLFLLSRKGKALSKERIFSYIWGDKEVSDSAKLIDVLIFKIRENLRHSDAPYIIDTLYRQGYLIRDRLPGELHRAPRSRFGLRSPEMVPDPEDVKVLVKAGLGDWYTKPIARFLRVLTETNYPMEGSEILERAFGSANHPLSAAAYKDRANKIFEHRCIPYRVRSINRRPSRYALVKC